jgi:hypothetical protein
VVALDVDRARDAARAADDARVRGESMGMLHGLPMTVKDSFETEGLTTVSGAPELAEYVPSTDADAVARLHHRDLVPGVGEEPGGPGPGDARAHDEHPLAVAGDLGDRDVVDHGKCIELSAIGSMGGGGATSWGRPRDSKRKGACAMRATPNARNSACAKK